MKNPYACPACDGKCVTHCPHCDSEIDCEECNGSGLDAAKIDVKSFLAAEMELRRRTGSTRPWAEGEFIVGRRSKTETLAYADFAKKEATS